MTTTVGQIDSDVTVEPPDTPAPEAPAPGSDADAVERLRAMQRQLQRDRARTCAEGFDD